MKKKSARTKAPAPRGKALRKKPAGSFKRPQKHLPNTPSLEEQTHRLHAGVTRLHAAADTVHQKADELHQEIDKAHKASTALNRRSGAAGSEAEISEIVIDDGRGETATPFPIVGIGASAGGYEAFADFLKHLPK